jgi:hypothetical protein
LLSGIKSVDAAVPSVPGERLAIQYQGKVFQGFLIPGGNMGERVSHRPVAYYTRLKESIIR